MPAPSTDSQPPIPPNMEYPSMRRRLAIIRLRQRLRGYCDRVGLGPSFSERLCCALTVAVIPFVVSFILAFSFREPAGYAALQGVGAFAIVAGVGALLIGGADDEILEAQRVNLTSELPKAAAKWLARKQQPDMDEEDWEEEEEEEEIIEPVPTRARRVQARSRTKRCPYCAEKILAEARKCKHCGEILEQPFYRDRRPDRTAISVSTNVDNRIHIGRRRRSDAVAVLLELLFGFFFQTFGVGHIYAGNVGLGLFLMFGYWMFLFVNFVLTMVTCSIWGYAAIVIIPAVWFILMGLSPLLAASACSDN